MRRWNRLILIVLALVFAGSGVARAELQQSTSYSMNESELGAASGDFTSSSAHYSNVPHTDDSGSTLGDNFVGNSSSTNYQTNSGFNTTAQPGLTMLVNTASVDFGTVTPGTAATATATFDVTDYTSYGYVVTVVGNPPTMGSHQLTALTTDTASDTSAEQFGLNAVKNTSPVNPLGDDPLQKPDNVYTSSAFSYGVAGTGVGTAYAQANKFRYVSNDSSPVASAAKSSGDTLYTLSFLMNVKTTTPGGRYSGNLAIVVTGTY
jgi:hypothetical protein